MVISFHFLRMLNFIHGPLDNTDHKKFLPIGPKIFSLIVETHNYKMIRDSFCLGLFT